MAVGMHDWKTIAPVMLPIASVSLPLRTQMRLLNFSGSSVAIGAMMSASRTGSSSRSRRAMCSTASDEDDRAADDHRQRDQDLQVDDAQARLALGSVR